MRLLTLPLADKRSVAFQAMQKGKPATTATAVQSAPVMFGNAQKKIGAAPSQTELDRQVKQFIRWADEQILADKAKGNPFAFALPSVPLLPAQPTGQRAFENARTIDLFKRTFDNFLWTGIECSNNLTPKGERYDELEMGGVYNPKERKRQIDTMLKNGFKNVRLGLPTHKIVNDGSWKTVTSLINDFKLKGAKISLDLQHFGLPDHLTNVADPQKSQYLNPKWPQWFARFAESAVKRYFDDLDAITIINEPIITNKFSGLFWNECVPGSEGHDAFDRAFIERGLLIAKAATDTRSRIEGIIQKKYDSEKARKVFLHNDSMEGHHLDPDFMRYKRWLNSDLILGQDWLLKADLNRLATTPLAALKKQVAGKNDMLQWMVHQYVFTRPAREQEAARTHLVKELEAVQKAHLDFQKRYGKTMKADTVFGLDYYANCESGNGIVKDANWTPQYYLNELKNGDRNGLYNMAIEAWNRYQIPLIHAETNIPEPWGAIWGRQQALELSRVAKAGVPVLGFNWYSLMDQWGWNTALTVSPKEAVMNPVGLVDYQTHQPRSFAKDVLPGLRQALEEKDKAAS